MQRMQPLAITAYTATSALGRGVDSQWSGLSSGRTGLSTQHFSDCGLSCWTGQVAGLDTPLPSSLSVWDCRNNRLAHLGLQQDDFAAAVTKLRERYQANRIGVFIGTSTSGILQTELAYRARAETITTPGGDGPLPDWFHLRQTQNSFSPAEFVATACGLAGPVMTISTACSSSAKVFASAARAIAQGWCDAAVVGGVDTLCLTTLYGFNSLQLISSDICRPADAQRSGISIGEAAGFAVLESVAHAQSECALLGYGESSDAYHMSAPDPEGRGAATAMRDACARAELRADAIGYVNLHGTGTPANDAAEDRAICAVLGEQVPCSSTKGWTGHTLGAAGILEAVITLVCLQHRHLPRSLNTQTIDPSLRGKILLEDRAARINYALSNSFGFGGSNCSLLFGVTP
jgi:3-oxoacyl-[acyl-carrier-protein] synthase-1